MDTVRQLLGKVIQAHKVAMELLQLRPHMLHLLQVITHRPAAVIRADKVFQRASLQVAMHHHKV